MKILAKNEELKIELWLLEEQVENAYFDRLPAQIEVLFVLNKQELQQLNQHQQSELACKKIVNLLENQDIGLFINFNSHFDFFLAKYSLNIPITRWVHGMAHCEYWERSYDYHHFILKKHHCLVAVNEELKAHCLRTLKRLKITDLPVHQIYNPVDFENILALSNQEEAFENGYLLQVSRLDKSKNHLQLIDIYAKLKQLRITEKLLIVGDGENYFPLQQYIEKLGLQQDCLLLGRKANPYPLMKNAKLFLHTSLSEGLPTVLIESMVCGTPVVAMDCQTGPKEILNNGECGELVDLGDVDQFVQKTYDLLNNEVKLTVFRQKSAAAIERFSFESIEQQVLILFNSIQPSTVRISEASYKKSRLRKWLLKIH